MGAIVNVNSDILATGGTMKKHPRDMADSTLRKQECAFCGQRLDRMKKAALEGNGEKMCSAIEDPGACHWALTSVWRENDKPYERR